jgi:hypothetical protein
MGLRRPSTPTSHVLVCGERPVMDPQEPIGQLFRDVSELAAETAQRITDTEVDVRLRRLLLFARIDFAIERDGQLTPDEALVKALATAVMTSPGPGQVECDECPRCLIGYHCRRCAHRARGGGARHPGRR